MKKRTQDRFSRRKLLPGIFTLAIASAFGIAMLTGSTAAVAGANSDPPLNPGRRGELDCNGFSPVQKALRANECTDIRGDLGVDNSNTWGGRFYDNGHYIGHDEPDTTFLSNAPGSGNNVNWNVTLGRDPSGGTDSYQPRTRRLALVRAVACAMVLDGPVRPQLLPADTVHP